MPRLAVLLALCGCLCTVDETKPPPQPGDCPDTPGATQVVELGFGRDAFARVAPDGSVPPVSGPQGGSHVWTAVRAKGFSRVVGIAVEAKDVFSGAVLASGEIAQIPLNQREGAPAGECEFHGVAMFLESLGSGDAGLATVTATVREAAGRTGSASQRVWLGKPAPSCLPDQAVVPAVTPLVGESELNEVADDATIELPPGFSRWLTVGAAVQGFAGSATRFVVELRDPELPGEPLLRAEPPPPPERGPPAPTERETGELRCVLAATTGFEVRDELLDRPLTLRVAADDGLGHAAEASRRITFRKASGGDR